MRHALRLARFVAPYHELSWHIEVYSDRISKNLLPIASTEGADKICIELEGPGRGQIIFWDGYEQTGNGIYPVAKDFTNFVENLFRDEDSPKLHVVN